MSSGVFPDYGLWQFCSNTYILTSKVEWKSNKFEYFVRKNDKKVWPRDCLNNTMGSVSARWTREKPYQGKTSSRWQFWTALGIITINITRVWDNIPFSFITKQKKKSQRRAKSRAIIINTDLIRRNKHTRGTEEEKNAQSQFCDFSSILFHPHSCKQANSSNPPVLPQTLAQTTSLAEAELSRLPFAPHSSPFSRSIKDQWLKRQESKVKWLFVLPLPCWRRYVRCGGMLGLTERESLPLSLFFQWSSTLDSWLLLF
jgi:hypothetical protein